MSDYLNIPYAQHVVAADKERIVRMHKQSLSTNELFNLLGASVDGDAATGQDSDGESVFNSQLLRIKNAVCDNDQIINFLESPQGGDTTNLVIVLTGALTAAKFFGIDVIAVAFLITRIGVRKLCEVPNIE